MQVCSRHPLRVEETWLWFNGSHMENGISEVRSVTHIYASCLQIDELIQIHFNISENEKNNTFIRFCCKLYI